MNKLKEYLNEYEPRIAINGEYYDNVWIYRYFKSEKTEKDSAASYIISKSYGFIKWLVDNDKIDLNEYPQIREYSEYESLLMYLSIQDEPIEFLCSILK